MGWPALVGACSGGNLLGWEFALVGADRWSAFESASVGADRWSALDSALVGADRWSALRLPGHPRMAWIYCGVSPGGCRPLVGIGFCPGGCRLLVGIETARPSTHGVDLLRNLARWVPTVGRHSGCPGIHAWRGSTADSALVGADRWSALRLTPASTHGVDLLRNLARWEPTVGRRWNLARWVPTVGRRWNLPWWVPTVGRH